MAKRSILVLICMTLILSIVITPFSASAATKTVPILRAADDYIRVRSEPSSTSGEVLGTLRKGTKMFYLGREGSWAYVMAENGARGYIYSGFLSYYGQVRLSNIYSVRSSSLKVYAKPSTSSRRIATLPNDYFVILRAANGMWGEVRSLSGNKGYVLLSGLKRVG